MLAFLPILALALLFLFLQLRRVQGSAAHGDWRDSFTGAVIAWGVLLFALTEALSALKALTTLWLAAAWLVVCSGLCVALIASLRGSGINLRDGLRRRLEGLAGPGPKIVFLGVLVLVALSCVVAIAAPAHDSDVVAYHLGRVAHWAQNRSVAYYGTPDVRQVWMPPWPEYAVLHLFLLAGGDVLANCVQWFSMVAILVLVSRMAALLGAGQRGQLFAAAVGAAAPPLMSQASLAASDVVPALWVACAAWVVLRFRETDGAWGAWLWLAACGGLALLSKGAAVVYAAPFFLWFLWNQLRGLSFRRWFLRACLLGAILLLSGALMWARNWASFGSPFGPAHVVMLTNETFGLAPTFSNLIRNLSVQVATPSGRWNNAVAAGVRELHRILGLDPQDPRTSYGGGYGLGWLWPGNNASPFHLALFCAAGIALLVPAQEGKDQRARGAMWLSTVAGLVLYSAVFKIQGAMRFQIPFLVMSAPMIGAWVGAWRSRPAGTWLVLGLLAVALPVVAFDRWRPLARIRPFVDYDSVLIEARMDIYFRSSEGLRPAYERVANRVIESGCGQVGLSIGSHDLEYLWWVLLQPLQRGMRIEHILVWPGLEQYQDPSFQPCAVICTECNPSWEALAGLRGEEPDDGVRLFLPSGGEE